MNIVLKETEYGRVDDYFKSVNCYLEVCYVE